MSRPGAVRLVHVPKWPAQPTEPPPSARRTGTADMRWAAPRWRRGVVMRADVDVPPSSTEPPPPTHPGAKLDDRATGVGCTSSTGSNTGQIVFYTVFCKFRRGRRTPTDQGSSAPGGCRFYHPASSSPTQFLAPFSTSTFLCSHHFLLLLFGHCWGLNCYQEPPYYTDIIQDICSQTNARKREIYLLEST